VTGYQAATNLSEPAPVPGPEGQDAELMPVFLTVAVRTSAGPGPGPKHLPRAEAGRLVAMHHAVPGDRPPPNWSGPVAG